jgi:hypothetical protein
VYVWFAGTWLVQAGDDVGGEDADGDLLRDDCFAVTAEVVFEGGVEAVIVSCGRGDCAVRVGRCGCYDCEGEDGEVVLFSKANLGRCGVYGGF